MSSISLTSGMKSALLSLQSTQKLYDGTQERLTTGKKVSSPADDPAAYYAASTLTDRASALEGRLDNMDQAVEAISSADNGIEAMTSVLSSMTAIVESALASDESDSSTRAALGKKFNDLLRQLSTLADDSAYAGVNLLDGQDVTVQMGEDYNDSIFTVEGFYVAGLDQDPDETTGEVGNVDASTENNDALIAWGTGAQQVTNYAFALNMVENPTAVVGIKSYGTGSEDAATLDALQTAMTTATTAVASITSSTTESQAATVLTSIRTAVESMTGATASTTTTPSTVSVTTESGYTYIYTESDGSATTDVASLTIERNGVTVATPTSTLAEVTTALGADTEELALYKAFTNYAALENSVKTAADDSDAATTITNAAAVATAATAVNTANTALTSFETDAWEIDWRNSDTYVDNLQTVLDEIEQVSAVLETRSKLLSFDQSTITLRQEYTEEFINTLEEGADSLTLADLNEESANLLSLETSQSLAVQAMSLANEQMQNVLRLLQ